MKTKQSRSNGRQTISDYEFGKIPPQARDIEEAVLGALMLEKDSLARVVDQITPEIFYVDANATIYKAIKRLYSETKPVDILTVTEQLRSEERLEQVGGAFYITELTNRVASTANLEFHLKIVQEKYLKRELIRIAHEILQKAYDDSEDVFDLIEELEKELLNLTGQITKTKEPVHIGEVIKDSIAQIERAEKARTEKKAIGITSGFKEIDRITGGWQDTDLIILAARPSMGKSALAWQFAINAALAGYPVSFFSHEMSSLQLGIRLIAQYTDTGISDVRFGQKIDWKHLYEKINPLMDIPLRIDDTSGMSIFQLMAKARREKMKYGTKLIISDYLQLLQGDKSLNRDLEIGTITRGLKATAKDLNIPVMALSQLSRAVEVADKKKPLLSHLRESGNIEQDADVVAMLYRPKYYKISPQRDGQPLPDDFSQFMIKKHRNGAIGDIDLSFNERLAMFTDFENDPF